MFAKKSTVGKRRKKIIMKYRIFLPEEPACNWQFWPLALRTEDPAVPMYKNNLFKTDSWFKGIVSRETCIN
jgi:hypothetical protein